MGILAVGRICRFAEGNRRMMSSISRSKSRSSINSVAKARDASPWLMMTPRLIDGKWLYHYRFYSLVDKKILNFEQICNELCSKFRIIGSSNGWVAWLHYPSRSLLLTDPVVRRLPIHLPSLDTIIPSGDVAADTDPIVPPLPIQQHSLDTCASGDRMKICCSPDRVLISYGGRLAFCVLDDDRNDMKWSLISKDNGDDDDNKLISKKYHSLVYSKRRRAFFCIKVDDQAAELESWDLTNPNSPTRNIHWDFDNIDFSNLKKFDTLQLKYKYLVLDEASDQLFLVVRHVLSRYFPHCCIEDHHPQPQVLDFNYLHNTVGFDVFKIDPELQSVSPIAGSLDGLAFFVGGSNDSFAARPRASSSSPLKPNSIYFTSSRQEHLYGPKPKYKKFDIRQFDIRLISGYVGNDGSDVGNYDDAGDGVFDYENRIFSSFFESYSAGPEDVKLRKMLVRRLPFWYTPIGDS